MSQATQGIAEIDLAVSFFAAAAFIPFAQFPVGSLLVDNIIAGSEVKKARGQVTTIIFEKN